MIRKDTRPLTVNGNQWEYKIGRKCVAIYDPEGNRYFPRFTEMTNADSPSVNPALILNHIQEKILKPKFIAVGMNKCYSCNKKKKDVILRINPFNAEIHSDYTKHFMCKDCSDRAAEEI